MVLNTSTGILSHPLALLTAVLPKAHLTLFSRMSSSGWLTIPSWQSGSLDFFLHSFSVYFHLFLTSSASTRSLPFLSFIVPIFGQNVLLISPVFLKRSLVFPLLWFSSRFIHCSFRSPSYLSMLFFGNLHLVGYTFPFLPCFSHLCFAVC